MLDATVAGRNANSYVTLAEASDFARDIGADDFLRLPAEEREVLLKRACETMALFPVKDAERFDPSQALPFPRRVDAGDDGSPVMPAAVRKAQMLAAFYLASPAGRRGAIKRSGLRRASVGSDAEDYAPGYEVRDAIGADAARLLAPYLALSARLR